MSGRVLPEEFDLSGRTAIVTGGGAGIGAATALLLSRRGADVVIASRTGETLERRAADIQAVTGRRCFAVPTDVRDEDQVKHLIQRTLNEIGRIDILINNAGGSRRRPSARPLSFCGKKILV